MFDKKLDMLFKHDFLKANSEMDSKLDCLLLVSEHWRTEKCFPVLRIN